MIDGKLALFGSDALSRLGLHQCRRIWLGVVAALAVLASTLSASTSPAGGQSPVAGAMSVSLEAINPGAAIVYSAPGGEPVTTTYTYLDGSVVGYPLTNPTHFGNPLVFAVTSFSEDGEWAQVLLPSRPNESTGWVPVADYVARSHDRKIHIIKDVRSLVIVDQAGRSVFQTPVGFGAADTPTPNGLTYIDEIVEQTPGRPLLSLAMFSDSIQQLDGALPKVAIASSPVPHLIDADNTRGVIMASLDVMPELQTATGGAGTFVTIWATQDEFRAATGDTTPKFCAGLAVTVDLAAGEQPTEASDVIVGTMGDDLVAAGAGDDTICALDGDDSIWGQAGADLIHGGPGTDRLRGGDGNDRINGGADPDDIAAGRGDDWVVGGPGDDTKLRGGTGDDELRGSDGDDALIAGNGGEDTVIGDAGNDKLTGGPRPDVLFGGEGDDELRGGGGADSLSGDDGVDRLFGGPQPDMLDGGFGGTADECNGGTEQDQFVNCATVVDIP